MSEAATQGLLDMIAQLKRDIDEATGIASVRQASDAMTHAEIRARVLRYPETLALIFSSRHRSFRIAAPETEFTRRGHRRLACLAPFQTP